MNVQLRVATVNKGLDFMCFNCTDLQSFLPLHRDCKADMPRSCEFVLCSFQLGLCTDKAKKEFGHGLAAFTVGLFLSKSFTSQMLKAGFMPLKTGIHPGRCSICVLCKLQAHVLGYSRRGHFLVYSSRCSPWEPC